jgi:hypothetical protein
MNPLTFNFQQGLGLKNQSVCQEHNFHSSQGTAVLNRRKEYDLQHFLIFYTTYTHHTSEAKLQKVAHKLANIMTGQSQTISTPKKTK